MPAESCLPHRAVIFTDWRRRCRPSRRRAQGRCLCPTASDGDLGRVQLRHSIRHGHILRLGDREQLEQGLSGRH